MSNPTPSDTQDFLQDENTLAIQVADDIKIQGNIDRVIGDTWSVVFDPKHIKLIKSSGYVFIEFIKDKKLHSGKAQLIRLDTEKATVIIAKPNNLQSRPIRTAPRARVELPAAIIISRTKTEGERFIPRTDNRIVDLSFAGAKIVCKVAFERGDEDFLVLSCLDKGNTTVKDKQIYLHARKVREAGPSPLADFPYAYGFQFDIAFPIFKKMIGDFVLTL